MRKNTFLIRFIDIGLILLFGFIVISDITIRAQIELPGSDPAEADTDRQPYMITIEVRADQTFRIVDAQQETVAGEPEGLEQLEVQLDSYADQIRQQGRTPVALIELDHTTQMQTLIDVLDLCDKLGIPKNVNEETLRL